MGYLGVIFVFLHRVHHHPQPTLFHRRKEKEDRHAIFCFFFKEALFVNVGSLQKASESTLK